MEPLPASHLLNLPSKASMSTSEGEETIKSENGEEYAISRQEQRVKDESNMKITRTPPTGGRRLSSYSSSNSPLPLHAEQRDESSSKSPTPPASKVFLIQTKDTPTETTSNVPSAASSSSATSVTSSDSLLAAPINPLLAPLDTTRPTKPAGTTMDASMFDNSSQSSQASAVVAEAVDSLESYDQTNALESWDELQKSLRGKQLVFFLDYDGTLTPIVAQPSEARISQDMREKLAALANTFPVAVVTGRKLDTILEFIEPASSTQLPSLSKLYYAGSHGFDIRCPLASSNKTVATEYLPYLAEFQSLIAPQIERIEGAQLEDNRFSLSVHYRNVKNDSDKAKMLDLLQSELIPYVAKGQLRLTHGHMVYEIRAGLDWHKGSAVNYLLQLMCSEIKPTADSAPLSLDTIVPIYIGDDKTDEDAFRMMQSYRSSKTHANAMGILVREDKAGHAAYPSAANFVVRNPQEVGQLLEKFTRLQQNQ